VELSTRDLNGDHRKTSLPLVHTRFICLQGSNVVNDYVVLISVHGSLDIVSYDAGADDINVESISGRRSSENSITRITVNVHTDSQQADDEMCVRISDISCQRNYGRDNENL
jgi:hypothetical protein